MESLLFRAIPENDTGSRRMTVIRRSIDRNFFLFALRLLFEHLRAPNRLPYSLPLSFPLSSVCIDLVSSSLVSDSLAP